MTLVLSLASPPPSICSKKITGLATVHSKATGHQLSLSFLNSELKRRKPLSSIPRSLMKTPIRRWVVNIPKPPESAHSWASCPPFHSPIVPSWMPQDSTCAGQLHCPQNKHALRPSCSFQLSAYSRAWSGRAACPRSCGPAKSPLRPRTAAMWRSVASRLGQGTHLKVFGNPIRVPNSNAASLRLQCCAYVADLMSLWRLVPALLPNFPASFHRSCASSCPVAGSARRIPVLADKLSYRERFLGNSSSAEPFSRACVSRRRVATFVHLLLRTMFSARSSGR